MSEEHTHRHRTLLADPKVMENIAAGGSQAYVSEAVEMARRINDAWTKLSTDYMRLRQAHTERHGVLAGTPTFLARFRAPNAKERQVTPGREKERLRLSMPSSQEVVFDEVSAKDAISSSFKFDQVFHEDAATQEVYDFIQPAVQKMLARSTNLVIILNGHSGSGKTYTMFDGEDSLAANCVRDIFSWSNSQTPSSYEIALESYEYYQNDIYDIIDERRKLLFAMFDEASKKFGPQGRRQLADSPTRLIELFDKARKARSTAKMKQNSDSSRSHAFYTISISYSGTDQQATLTIVDLAGNEKVDENIQGERKKENTSIVQSQLAFQNLITNMIGEPCTKNSFVEVSVHGRYRDVTD